MRAGVLLGCGEFCTGALTIGQVQQRVIAEAVGAARTSGDDARELAARLSLHIALRIGKAHGKSASQIALRYLVQQRIIPIPRTANPEHLAANLAIFDFALTDDEMGEIDGLRQAGARVVNPPHAPKWDA